MLPEIKALKNNSNLWQLECKTIGQCGAGVSVERLLSKCLSLRGCPVVLPFVINGFFFLMTKKEGHLIFFSSNGLPFGNKKLYLHCVV